MNKKEFFWRLQNKLPGEKCNDSKLNPPQTDIYFKNINEDSLLEFHQYSLNTKLYEFFEFKPFKDLDDTKKYYKKMLKRMHEDKTHYYWFVYKKKDNRLIGTATLASINFERLSVEWGQGIDPDYWGLNYNLQINELLKHYIFDILHLNRLFGQTMINNKRAIECVKASGCNFEGILREFYKKDQVFIDGWMYSLLSKEYFQEAKELTKSVKISIKEIVELISTVTKEDNINEQSSMENCLNWDSLSHTSIIAGISDKYKIKMTPTQFTKLTSVKLIYEFLNK
tara:strand:+ start:1018 stop:1866 length:849 start_codon:yes stop_codon:yes gene_type:complete